MNINNWKKILLAKTTASPIGNQLGILSEFCCHLHDSINKLSQSEFHHKFFMNSATICIFQPAFLKNSDNFSSCADKYKWFFFMSKWNSCKELLKNSYRILIGFSCRRCIYFQIFRLSMTNINGKYNLVHKATLSPKKSTFTIWNRILLEFS